MREPGLIAHATIDDHLTFGESGPQAVHLVEIALEADPPRRAAVQLEEIAERRAAIALQVHRTRRRALPL